MTSGRALRVAVVGGGISGLAAAWELRDRAEVTVFEPGRPGGCLVTEAFGGRPVDCGPDAFVTRAPAAVELCAELGLEMVAPSAGRALIWWRGRLHPIPDGLVLGVPRGLGPLVRSDLVSWRGVVRAAADLALPRTRVGGDVAVHDLVRRRLGSQVADRLVDPLVSSIHAGRSDRLSAEATTPNLYAAARSSRSLMRGLAAPAGDSPAEPVFLAPVGGTATLADALHRRLVGAGVAFEASRVSAVAPAGEGVEVDGERFDRAVLAVRAADAAGMLGPGAPAGLRSIATASVALVAMGFDGEAPFDGKLSGILVPPSEGMLMTACSFASSKWPHWSRPGRVVLRVSVGREGDDRFERMGDERIVDELTSELSRVLARPVAPDEWRVSRWPGAFPQYHVGHAAKVRELRESLRSSAPCLALCGASYTGVGVPACIASGRQAARALLA